MRQYLLLLFLGCAVVAVPAKAGIHVTWDLSSAETVLAALSTPPGGSLSPEEIAVLPGNRALIEKMAWNDPAINMTVFVDAIKSAQAGEESQDPFQFGQVKRWHKEVLAHLEQVSSQKEALNRNLEIRLASYLPEDFELSTTVRVVIGGNSAGWTTGNGEFYMSSPHYMKDPILTMEINAAHELFHIAQEQLMPYTASTLKNPQHAAAENLVISLVREGTARLLDDPMLTDLEGKMLSRDRERENRNRARLASAFLLYENLVFRAFHDPMADLQAIYAAGFFGEWDTFAYAVGLHMASTIVESDGREGLVALLQQPPANFVRRYIAITEDAEGSTHPTFGQGFIGLLKHLP